MNTELVKAKPSPKPRSPHNFRPAAGYEEELLNPQRNSAPPGRDYNGRTDSSSFESDDNSFVRPDEKGDSTGLNGEQEAKKPTVPSEAVPATPGHDENVVDLSLLDDDEETLYVQSNAQPLVGPWSASIGPHDFLFGTSGRTPGSSGNGGGGGGGSGGNSDVGSGNESSGNSDDGGGNIDNSGYNNVNCGTASGNSKNISVSGDYTGKSGTGGCISDNGVNSDCNRGTTSSIGNNYNADDGYAVKSANRSGNSGNCNELSDRSDSGMNVPSPPPWATIGTATANDTEV